MGHKRKRAEAEVSAAVPAPKKQQKKREKNSTKPSPTVSFDIAPFVDNPKGDELKREVQLYDLLASEDEVERLSAANAIVSGLLEGGGVEEPTLQRHLERRLFRGIASGRKGARLGYSVVLAEILGQLFGDKDLSSNKYTGLTFDKTLGFLIAKTKPDGDLSGQELKDHFLGLLFGLQSFVRAKILFVDDDRWAAIFEKLLDLSKKKPWIREECGWVIVEALAQMDQEQAEKTLEKLQEFGLATSPEGVGIWLQAKNRFPDMKCPVKPWGQNGNPLEHLKALGKALKESSMNDDSEKSERSEKVNQTGNWNPKLHFVWNLVLAQYAAANAEASSIKSDFENFWKVAVDENLFSATASRERKFWGFLLFQKVLQEAESYGFLLSSIFSRNLMRCLINHIQDTDRFLNRSADKSLKVLIQSIESTPDLLPIVLPCLVGGYGTYNFDKVTKTKTIERLLAMVDRSNASLVTQTLTELAASVPGTDADTIREADLRRLTLSDYLLNLVKKINATEGDEDHSWIRSSVLPTIARFAYSKCEDCQPPLSEKTRTIFRNRLQSAFTHLFTDLTSYKYTCTLLETVSLDAVQMDAGILHAKDKAISTMEKILKKAKKANELERAPLQALALLYSLVIFQLYNGESEAISILDELKLCYDKLIRHKNVDDSDVDASEVLVELLLSFISKPSALLRKVTQLVFAAFMSDIGVGGLKLMTDVLESSESLRGQQELFDQEPEDGDDMEVDEEGELDSDIEVVDMNGDEGIFESRIGGGDDDSDAIAEGEEEDSDEPEDEEAKKLDDALAKALGTHRLDEDAVAESDSDADMTDSEMMALDAKLVEIFKQRKKIPNKKQEQKDAKENMVNFKTRVLDLLDLYVKKQASNPLAFGLLLPLLQLIRTTKTKQLAEKAHGIIIAFAKATKRTEGEVATSEQIKLLKAIHLEASKDPSHSFSKAASTASLLVASNLYRSNKGMVKKVAGVYRDSQVAWVEGEVKMQAAFFMEWINWCQSHANT